MASAKFEYRFGPHNSHSILGSFLVGKPTIDRVVSELQKTSPYNGDGSFDDLSDEQIVHALFDGPNPVHDATIPDELFDNADVLAIGANGAMGLRIDTEGEGLLPQQVLSDRTIRIAIESVTGPYSEIVFPPIVIN